METIFVSRAPVSVTLGGDGANSENSFEEHGGIAISAAISYYVYAIVAPSQLDGVQVLYGGCQAHTEHLEREGLTRHDELDLLKAIAYHFNVSNGLSIFISSQVPPVSGLGLTEGIAVSVIKALAFCCGLDLEPREVADLACHIQADKLGMCVNRRDLHAAAFGGLHCVAFSRGKAVVEPVLLSPCVHQALEKNLMLFFVGTSNPYAAASSCQVRAKRHAGRETPRALETMKGLTPEMRAALQSGDLEMFGHLLHRAWVGQWPMEGASFPLDQYYQLAREHGALGGKATSGGDFLVLCCPEDKQGAVTEALEELDVRRWPFILDEEGVRVMQAVPWSRSHATSMGPWPMHTVPQRASSAAGRTGSR